MMSINGLASMALNFLFCAKSGPGRMNHAPPKLL